MKKTKSENWNFETWKNYVEKYAAKTAFSIFEGEREAHNRGVGGV